MTKYVISLDYVNALNYVIGRFYGHFRILRPRFTNARAKAEADIALNLPAEYRD